MRDCNNGPAKPCFRPARKTGRGVHLCLAAFDPHIPAQYLPSNSLYGFVSIDGDPIWRNAGPGHGIGTRPNSDAVRMIVQVRDGEFVSRSIDGVLRYFSVVPMPETGWLAYVGVPLDEVYGAARQRAITAAALPSSVPSPHPTMPWLVSSFTNT